MSNPTKQHPSEVIETFLDYLEQCKTNYETAFDIVGEEDKRDQDLKHDIELAPNESEFIKASRRYRKSRKLRRANKDIVTELEGIVTFYNDQGNRPFFKRLKDVVRKQKFTESYLDSDRVYKPRKKGDAVNEDCR